ANAGGAGRKGARLSNALELGREARGGPARLGHPLLEALRVGHEVDDHLGVHRRALLAAALAARRSARCSRTAYSIMAWYSSGRRASTSRGVTPQNRQKRTSCRRARSA